jgi:hypothetical protein
MENVEISFNKDKLIPFIFQLKSKIDLYMKTSLIETSNECLGFIQTEISKSDNIFRYSSNEGLVNLSEQIFYYYFGANEIDLPISKYIKDLSLLN